MAVKTTTDVLGLTKYNEVDMPEELNVLSDDMQKIDDFAGEINTWKETVDDKIDELEEEIDVLQPQSIIALENKVNANASAIDNLTTDVSSIRQRVSTVEGDIENLNSEQAVQNDRLDAIEVEQIVQNEAISDLSDDITNLNTNLTNYENTTNARLNTIETDIEQLKAEDEIITTQLSTHATELADHEERISALEGGSGSTIPQRVTDLETEVGVLDSSVQGLNTDMDNAESAIGTLQTDVGSLQTAVNNINTSVVPAIEGELSTHYNLIKDVNQRSLRFEEYDYTVGTVSANAFTPLNMTIDELYHSLAGDTGLTAVGVFMFHCYGSNGDDFDAKIFPDMQSNGDLVIKTTVAQNNVTAILWFIGAENPY